MDKNNKKTKKVLIIVAILLISISVINFKAAIHAKNFETIEYSIAQEKIVNREIDSVKTTNGSSMVYLYSEDKNFKTDIPDIVVFSQFMEEQRKEGNNIKFEVKEYNSYNTTILILTAVLKGVLIFAVLTIVFRMLKKFMDGSVFTEKQVFNKVEKNTYTFKDVAGIDKEKAELEEIVELLKNPGKYLEIGARIPKGILLEGEPGTGKTLLAKAIAGEANVPFYTSSGSNFENMYVGAGAARVRSLFEEAKNNAPCIVFIDEIDSVARKRYDEKTYSEQTLNQLLNEMDGFDTNTNIIVIAATNHIEVLDPAIVRPGRFDRIIKIPLPNEKARREIIEIHARGKKFDDNKEYNLNQLAKKTSNMTGADLENILNEAAIITARNGKESIDSDDLDEAFIKVVLGISKDDEEVSEEEKRLTAIHEAGHTLVSRILKPEIEILQVSIIPRGTAGGYTLFADDPKILSQKNDLSSKISVLLGGRAAEETIYGTISIGASSDLKKATELAHSMVYDYAMGENAKLVRIYGESDYNERLEEKMFSKMEDIVDKAYEKSLKVLEENKEILQEIAEMLMKKSTLDTKEIEVLFSEFNI